MHGVYLAALSLLVTSPVFAQGIERSDSISVSKNNADVYGYNFSWFDAPAFSMSSLGEMMCSISYNIGPFEPLMYGLAYIGGALVIGSGLFHLIKHHDQLRHHEHPISRPLARLVAGACLLALPAFIKLSINSIFGTEFGRYNSDESNGLSACAPVVGAGGYGVYGGDVGLDGLMINLVTNIKSPMVFMLTCICVLTGIFLVSRGLYKAAKFDSDPRAHSVPNILANIIIGTILYTIGQSLDTMMTTMFGSSDIEGDGTIMSWIANTFEGNTAPFQAGVYAALTFFQMIGMIAFIRGWLILKDAAEGAGQKTVSQGLTHIMGGVLAINIYRFLEVLDNTFGTGFLS